MRTRTGYLTCRLRHLKCDETKPTCNRCMRGNRECIHADPADNFRNVFTTAGGVKTTSVSQQRAEATEKSTLTAENIPMKAYSPVHNEEVASSPGILARNVDTFISPTESQLTQISQPQLQAEPSPQMSCGDNIEAFPSTRGRETVVTSSVADTLNYQNPSPESSNSTTVAGVMAITPQSYALPRQDTGIRCLEHAALFRVFRERWAPGLDSQDADRHFTLDVLQRAQRAPVLLNAILAVASLHQSRLYGSSIAIPEQYHEACVKLILSMLHHADRPVDELLLATTVILRVYEQMNGSFNDDECHLLGASALASAQAATSGSLWKAAFWVYLRQDIYMAILDQRPIKTDLSMCTLWENEVPTNDCEWSQVIVLIVADIIGFCFSQNNEEPADRWASLRERLDKWSFCRPASFEPYYFNERNVAAGKYFPDFWLSEQCHVTALIYYHMGHALLLIYDPNHTGGINARRQQRVLEVQVAHHARIICGICLSNPTAETRRTACYAMFLCCRYLTDPMEQLAILDILQETEVKEKWPTTRISQILEEEWDINN